MILGIAIYDLLRAGHILAAIAWMAGMLYLPRLYAYDAEQRDKPEPLRSEMQGLLREWQAKLLRIIVNPAMLLAWTFGLALLWYDGTTRGWSVMQTPWMLVKLTGVLLLSGWHGVLAAARRKIAAGTDTRPARFWRMTNEIPFLLAIVMVLAVTTEFGG